MNNTHSTEPNEPTAAELGLLREILALVFDYTKARVPLDPRFKQVVPGRFRRILRFDSNRLQDQSLKIIWAALNDSEPYRSEVSDRLFSTEENPPRAAVGGEGSSEDRPGTAEADATEATEPEADPESGTAEEADGESDPSCPRLAELFCDPGMLFVLRPDGWETAYELHCRSANLTDENKKLQKAIRKLEAASRKAARGARLQADDATPGQESQDLLEKLRKIAEESKRLRKELQTEADRCQGLEAQVEELSQQCDKAEKDLQQAAQAGRKAKKNWNIERKSLLSENTTLQHTIADLQTAASRGIDKSDLHGAVQEFQDGLAALQAELLANLLQLDPQAPPTEPSIGDSATGCAPTVERRPRDLPQGLDPDSLEAADHLCGIENSCLIVDGYNVTMNRWDTTEVEISEQRARLDRRLEQFCARKRNRACIVWDGIDPDTPPQTGRDTGVQHIFSARGSNADDLLIEKIQKFPPTAPLVVVTSDKELRQRAATLGANVIGSDRLWQVLDSSRKGGTE